MEPSSNPKVTYLAVMPRHRTPKVISPSSVGFYQMKAKAFYEAPGMSAAEAREAIKEGSLQPTWRDGAPVVAYDVKTGRGRTEKRAFLGEVLKQAESVAGVMRIGTKVYTPHRSYRRAEMGWDWHEVGPSGFTYSQDPILGRDLERHVKAKDSWEVGLLTEDYQGAPMGALWAIAQYGMGLEEAHSPRHEGQVHSLGGTRFRYKQLASGPFLTPADLQSLMR